MPGKNVSSVDEKGRVLIPQSMRDALSLKAGEKVILELEGNSAVRVEPAHEKKLLHLKILLADSPGSLAHAAVALARLGVDLVSTNSHSSRRGEAAIWEVKCNTGKATVAQIRSSLSKVNAKIQSAQRE